MFTSRNAVVLALTQVGVIVAGVLACGASSKAWGNSGLDLPAATAFLLLAGPFLLLVPLVWIVVAMLVRQRASWSEDARQLVFAGGLLLLVALVVFEAYGIVSPWVKVFQAGDFVRTLEVE